MTKNNFIFVFFTIVLWACASEDKLPEGILDEEQMVAVIVDIELSQAMYKLKFANKDTFDFNQLVAYSFAQHNTTKKQFNASLVYYANHPKKAAVFYEKAIVILSKKQAEIQAQKRVDLD